MNRFVYDDRFFICNSLYQRPAFLLYANNGRFLHASMPSMHFA